MPAQPFQRRGIHGCLHLPLGEPGETHVDHQRGQPHQAEEHHHEQHEHVARPIRSFPAMSFHSTPIARSLPPHQPVRPPDRPWPIRRLAVATTGLFPGPVKSTNCRFAPIITSMKRTSAMGFKPGVMSIATRSLAGVSLFVGLTVFARSRGGEALSGAAALGLPRSALPSAART